MKLKKVICSALLVGAIAIPSTAAMAYTTSTGGTFRCEANDDTGFVNAVYYNPTYTHRCTAVGKTTVRSEWKPPKNWAEASAVLALYGNTGYYSDIT